MMLRYAVFILVCLVGFGGAVHAQDVPFASRASLYDFVDKHMAKRDFATQVARLGGADEYTPEELAGVDAAFKRALPDPLTQKAVLRTREMQAGFREELVVYWGARGYLWCYFLMHEREEGLLVVRFNFNIASEPIFSLF